MVSNWRLQVLRSLRTTEVIFCVAIAAPSIAFLEPYVQECGYGCLRLCSEIERLHICRVNLDGINRYTASTGHLIQFRSVLENEGFREATG